MAVAVMIIGAAIALPLARFADRDDAPGGILIAFLIFVAAAALAIRTVNERTESRARK
jgi:hypothetical protein